jgi:hypothetical protein
MWRNDQAWSPEAVAICVAICHSFAGGEASRAGFPCPGDPASSRSLQVCDFSSPATPCPLSTCEIPLGPLLSGTVKRGIELIMFLLIRLSLYRHRVEAVV